MNNLLNKVTLGAAAALALSVALPQQAQAISFNFSWQGDGGYSARGTFGYDETTAPAIITESGAGATANLDFLTVSFFDPSDNPLQSFNTVSDGVSQSPFFTFNFDTTTQQLFGDFNVGGGTGVIGEQFFTGTIGGLLQLRQDVNQMGASDLLDSQDPGVIAVTPVPEPLTILGAGTVIGLGTFFKRQQKSSKKRNNKN